MKNFLQSYKTELTLVGCILFFIALGVASNIRQQIVLDKSKIPNNIESSIGFQRWITNLKNNDLDISADDFRLLEENEIFNTKWTVVTSINEEGNRQKFDKVLRDNLKVKKVVFSPNKQAFIDYKDQTQAKYYGLRDSKIVESRLIECLSSVNCYIDRAYFITDDLMVVSEVSRNIDKKDKTAPVCTLEQLCTYTFKEHVINIASNSRSIYQSKPFDAILQTLAPEL